MVVVRLIGGVVVNADAPCTSIGLWKYLYAYSFFKTITPEDMEQALLLEGKFGIDIIRYKRFIGRCFERSC